MKKRIVYFLSHPLRLLIVLFTKYIPYFGFLYKTNDYQGKINFSFWFKQKVLNIGGNKKSYWPVHWTSKVFNPENILIGIDAYPGIMGGCYITGRGGLTIGDYTQIAPNVIIVTANHDLYDNRKHVEAPVRIGKYCWIGAGACILPGVVLGDWTIVGSGAVVTKSFPEGYVVIGGVPVTVIKHLNSNECVNYEHKHKYYGYISADKFEIYKTTKLKTN